MKALECNDRPTPWQLGAGGEQHWHGHDIPAGAGAPPSQGNATEQHPGGHPIEVSVAIQALSPADRQLVRNHFVLGLTIEQLSRIYHIDPSTIAASICRVVQQLRARMVIDERMWTTSSNGDDS